MTAPIEVIGVGADGPAGLRPGLAERVRAADFLAGGERHLAFFPEAPGERFVVKDNLSDLAGQLTSRHQAQRCVVLASGDPLFFGIGTYLLRAAPSLPYRFEPAVSSMQLAFARAGIPWQDAVLASVHGRDLRATLLPLLGRDRIGLFTQDGDSPAAVARFFLERGLGEYLAVVADHLGAADEQVRRFGNFEKLAGQRFSPLNYLILQRHDLPSRWGAQALRRALAPGIPDDVFARPERGPEVMTRQEVRSVILGKLTRGTDPGDTVWDVGAGLGTVSVELAVLRPHLEVVAVERDPKRTTWLKQNRERFGAYNIRVVEGEAPQALEGEAERPRWIFLGGSGGRLADVLALAGDRLREGGRLAASFVCLENLALCLSWARERGWPLEVTEVQVSRSDALGGLTGLKPQRGVFLACTDKP